MKGGYKIPAFIAISVFVTCMSILFISEKDEMNQMIYMVSSVYALVCLLFLLFQLYAFVQAHTDYDEDIENVKYRVFEAEEEDISYEN